MFISKDEGNARNETILCPLPLFATKNRETCETEHLMLHCSPSEISSSFLKHSWFIFLENEDFFAKIFALFALFRLFLREGDIFSRFRGGSFWAGPSHIQFHCVRLSAEEKTWLSPSSSLSSVSLEGKDGLRKLSTQCANWLKSSLNQPQWPD